jgi:hypothetical protein
MELPTHELSTRELDELTEIQLNISLENETELDKAINQLRPEALIALREDCLACIDRQHAIIRRVESRLAQK